MRGIRIAGIYLFLKSREAELDAGMENLVSEIEGYLYDRLSIEEMENLEKLYLKEDSSLKSKI
jgi:hypothetical protein